MEAGMEAEMEAGMEAEMEAGMEAGMEAEMEAGMEAGMAWCRQCVLRSVGRESGYHPRLAVWP